MTAAPTFTSACGALGNHDRDRVLAIAAALPGRPRVVHEDGKSILAIDRPPIRWGRGRRTGLGWRETAATPNAAPRSWQDAATSEGMCGLVIDGRRRYLHSSVSGIGTVYYLAVDGGVYFATAVDALALTAGRLSVDWEAWAGILTIHHPLGDRTPFAEIKRMAPFSMLEVKRGSARATAQRWPWAEVEPTLDAAAGAPDVAAAMRSSIERVGDGPIALPLSGGLDSRLCLGLLKKRREEITALTVQDAATDHETRVAEMLAGAVGIPHRTVTGGPESYWPDLAARALRVDYQFVRPPAQMLALRPLAEAGRIVVDGFGFDTLAASDGRFLVPATHDPSGDGGVASALWRRAKELHEDRSASTVRPPVARALWASARRQYLAESRQFAGHPARALLTHYWTRGVRAIPMNAYCLLGRDLAVALPLADDAVARASLRVALPSKRDFALYRAVYEEIAPELWDLPSTRVGAGSPGGPVAARLRSQTAAVADAQRACFEAGPLASWLRPQTTRILSRHHHGLPPRTRPGALGVLYFHLWHERYAPVLGEVDALAGLEAMG